MARPLLLDANSLIVRNIMATALQDLEFGGKFTGGIYNATRSLRGLVATPEWCVGRVYAFFDNGVPPLRLQLLPEYKSARQERREMLPEAEKERAFEQIDRCFEWWPTLGVTCVCFADREADDGVMAAVRLLADQSPIVVTSDRDLYQCVRFGAEVFDLNLKESITPDNFAELTGVHPNLWVLYRALTGDSSDSIAGVKGCGPKRSAQILWNMYDGFPDVVDQPPVEQCESLALHLALKLDRRTFEEAALLAVPRLQTICRAVDLSESWGGTTGLQAALDSSSKVSPRTFLSGARDLGMKSVLGDPDGWMGPFKAALSRA